MRPVFNVGLLGQRDRRASAALARTNEYMMKIQSFAQPVRDFLVSEDGPTAVEYAVMLGLIVMVCIVAVSSVGSKTCSLFTSASSKMN